MRTSTQIIVGFLVLVTLAAAGCVSQTFNLSQSKAGPQTTCSGSFGKQCRATYSGVKMEDGTIAYAIWTDKEFEEITAIDAKTKELILRNLASKEAFFQHSQLKPGETRRLLFTVVIDGVIIDTEETWEAILVGDKLLDLDTYLASTTAQQAPAAALVPTTNVPPAAPLPNNGQSGGQPSVPVVNTTQAPPANATPTAPAVQPIPAAQGTLAADEQAVLEAYRNAKGTQPAANPAPTTTGTTTVAAAAPAAAAADGALVPSSAQ